MVEALERAESCPETSLLTSEPASNWRLPTNSTSMAHVLAPPLPYFFNYSMTGLFNGTGLSLTDTTQSPAAVHISDLVSLHLLLLEKILQQEPISSGEDGYYFGLAYRCPWWKVKDDLAKSLYSLGPVTEPDVQVWPSYDEAADALGLPRLYPG